LYIEEKDDGEYHVANAPSIEGEVESVVVTVDGVEYRAIEAMGRRLLLGKASDTPEPTFKGYSVLCDDFHDWSSSYEFSGSIISALDKLAIPGVLRGMSGVFGASIKRTEVLQCATYIDDDDDETCSESSGIDGGIKENISDLTSVVIETGEQEPGDVPMALSCRLNMHLSKYEPYIDVAKRLHEAVRKTFVSLEITLGVIDGLQDLRGDILAQGYTQEQIDEAVENGASHVCYIGPKGASKILLTPTRMTDTGLPEGNEIGTLFALDTTKMIMEVVKNAPSSCGVEGEPFGKVYNVMDDEYIDGTPMINTGNIPPEDLKALGVVSIDGISTPGFLLAYKHAGTNKKKPIVVGYTGTSELDLLEEKMIIGTTPSVFPVTIITHQASGYSLVPTLDPDNSGIVIFINDKTIEFFVRDVFAPLAQNRTMKCMWEKQESEIITE
jgi:hypothetical protein